jgi:4-hydroxythreonine-4-phosphate dehydrogenase
MPASARTIYDSPLAVTMGDPAGIGAEIIIKAWMQRASEGLAPFAVYGDPALLAERARMLGADVRLAEIAAPKDASALFGTTLPVIAIPLAERAEPGRPSIVNAGPVIAAIERAVEDVHDGHARAVVTCPIAKSVLYGGGFPFPGHTEFLAALATRRWGGHHYHPVMMLASDLLRVVPMTIHVPLAKVSSLVTRTLIFETVRITWEALRQDFGIEAPRIAVCGLNPHAGEGGAIGLEDQEVVAPAVRDLRAEGFSVSGPHPADTMFHAAARKEYDAAIAMYHDQALIPIKTLSFDNGVNITLGLPFVRTSPDHGTAFGIAREVRASAQSLIAALKMAHVLSARRLSSTT